MKKLILLIIILFGNLIFVSGQSNPENDSAMAEAQRIEAERNRKDYYRKVGRTENERHKPDSRLLRLKNKLTKSEKEKIKPSQEDFIRYKQFLKKSKTGLVKIFPDFNCPDLIINADNENCLQAVQIKGNASYYSFRQKTHTKDIWSDVHFADNRLDAGFAKNSLGIFTDLGELSLESLDKNSPELKRLNDYRLPESHREMDFQKKELESGKLEEKGFSSKATVKLDTTFGLRLINYWRFRRYYGNENADILIVFRVVRKDTDGTITLLWKELQRKDTPEIKN